MFRKFIIAAVLVVAVACAALAMVPQTINYQGYLKNTDGTPVNGQINVTFSLYSTTSGAGPVWSSGQVSVTPQSGVYSLQLGKSPQPALPVFDRQYFLGVKAGTDPEMRPLQPLDSSPYSFSAKTAENVGLACSDGGVLVYRSNAWHCGTVTTFSNATAICVGTDCIVSTCSQGWGDCNGQVSDGCETNLNTDTGNCGFCGNRCPTSFYTNIASFCEKGTCANGYTVGGSVDGLLRSGLVLQNNGADDKSVVMNGMFTFATPLSDGSGYQVTVKDNPTGQDCQVSNGSGIINGAGVTGVAVTCTCLKWWPDADGDGYGNIDATPVSECVASKPGYASRGGDCDSDKSAAINPGAIEVCDQIDNNCDGQIDEGVHFCNTGQSCCSWANKTGYDACMSSFLASGPPFDTALLPCVTPSQSANPSYWLCYDPGDACDGVDNNCNGQVDEGQIKCGNPQHCPQAEICNGQDDDCNGLVDEGGVCGSCSWSFETCDGCDNDCDGIIDNNVQPEMCMKSDGSVGTRSCLPSANILPPGSCIAGKGWEPCQ